MEDEKYDILIGAHDEFVRGILVNFMELKGYSSKSVGSMDELKNELKNPSYEYIAMDTNYCNSGSICIDQLREINKTVNEERPNNNVIIMGFSGRQANIDMAKKEGLDAKLNIDIVQWVTSLPDKGSE